MIFLVLVGMIALVVLGLNWHDNNNLEQIENYLKAKECQTVIYSKGEYKGLCPDGLYIVPNSFSLEIKKSQTVVQYKSINNIEHKKENLLLHTNENIIEVKFKEEKNLQRYKEALQDKQ